MLHSAIAKLFGSYAQNAPKLKSPYLFAKTNAEEIDRLILANQTQAKWPGVSIIHSSRKNISHTY